MKMTLEFMWHEIKACVAGQVLSTQFSKHEIITINGKIRKDIEIHVA